MRNAKNLTISNIPEISAIYFALLQSGYGYYAMGRSQDHCNKIQEYIGNKKVPSFFAGVKQNTCEVYSYWPRAAILETASFYLSSNHVNFCDFDAFRYQIMSANNIADNERDQRLWDWIEDFPLALSEVLTCDAFEIYLKWEQKWLATQNAMYDTDLRTIKNCLDVCVSKYGSPVRDIQIIINPIKCIYSADYHLGKDCFIYCSGAFQVESVIHEFLHHVVHPAVAEISDIVLAAKRTYPDIDESYYLSGDKVGQLNAFEEYAVRALTKDVMIENYPDELSSYLRGI